MATLQTNKNQCELLKRRAQIKYEHEARLKAEMVTLQVTNQLKWTLRQLENAKKWGCEEVEKVRKQVEKLSEEKQRDDKILAGYVQEYEFREEQDRILTEIYERQNARDLADREDHYWSRT